jgi:2'-5' RNA ligase
MRLFVALDLEPSILSSLQALMNELKSTGADVRWVRPEGMHLTLKFIGEVAEEMPPRIEEALRRVTSAEPARLSFRGLGYFPNPRRPSVFWVGVDASENLPPVAAEIEAALEPLGIRREKRDYRPHLTLGRFKGSQGLSRLQEKIRSLPTTEFGEQEARAFFLYQSRLSPRGAQYTKLAEFPLGRVEG